jgi:hypothetical protein
MDFEKTVVKAIPAENGIFYIVISNLDRVNAL